MVPSVRPGPAFGLIGQLIVLATLDLGGVGQITALVYGLTLCALLANAKATFGPADWVTTVRATLVGAVTALTVDSFTRSAQVETLVAITVVALVLDAVDGQVARRTGTASAFGARFDMEVDAFLIAVLSVYVMREVGPWVLAIGAMRYAYVAAGWALPWLSRPTPPRYWCKVVAAIQGVVLVVAAADVLPVPVTIFALVVALGLLIESFGRDVVWLWRRHRRIGLSAGTARAG